MTPVELVGAYQVSKFLKIFILRGSVVDFGSSREYFVGERRVGPSAIVNAANEGCLGGGGADGAISIAGGPNLQNARRALPLVGYGIRCPTGQAVVTGPDSFGTLPVPYVIHAVGPNYNDYDIEEYETCHRLLRNAYRSALDLAFERRIVNVGFSLLSAGVYRGPNLSLKDVLEVGLEGLSTWTPSKTVKHQNETPYAYLCAFTPRECDTIINICEERFERLMQPTKSRNGTMR